jgi:NAD(P)-dependent dehydrogenase (short-subunit alcohol dehydrogenase family)
MSWHKLCKEVTSRQHRSFTNMNSGARKELALLTTLASLGLLWAGQKSMARAVGVASGILYCLPSLYTFRGKSVVITGGSRGLGFALAERFLKQRAQVALLARDADELEQARALLGKRTGLHPLIITCDVTQRGEVQLALEQVASHFGGIDILINNAGAIVIGPFESMELQDFEALLTVQVHAVVNATQAVLPWFRRHGGGRIANISSIGGRIAVPHMSVYCAGKFALAGLSASIAAELAAENILVTTVFPGLMRVGSPIQAVIKGEHEKEYAWFALGDSTPGLSVSAEYAARQIVEAIRRGDSQLMFPSTTRLASFAQSAFPELFAFATQLAARLQPHGLSSVRKLGSQSTVLLESQPWYSLFRPILKGAQDDNNQAKKTDPAFNLGL